ncbi:hypothetical protein GCM10027425_21000 [Alteromonas gracilis]
MSSAAEPVEIRLLGRLLVRDPEGRVVPPDSWRTQRATDLLALLALAPGHAMDIEDLLDELWPDAPEDRARASLRTATYLVRKALGHERIRRSGAALELDGVWVDADAWTSRAADALEAAGDGRHADAVRRIREAEALYSGDLTAGVGSPRLVGHQQRLLTLRAEACTAAAESALALGWFRDAADLAGIAHEVISTRERPVRVLMLALAAMGEVREALAAFDALRRALSLDLGVDPSPQTRAVHHQVLTGLAEAPVPAAADCGQVAEVAEAMRQVLTSGGGLVVLRGPAESGRARLAAASSEHLGHSLWSEVEATGAEGAGPTFVLLDPSTLTRHPAPALAASARATGRVLVALQSTEVPEPPASSGVVVCSLRALSTDELARLAVRVLRGEPSPGLVEELARVTGGSAGRAIDLLGRWVRGGRVIWTGEGLGLTQGASGRHVAEALHRVLVSTCPATVHVLGVLAAGEGAWPVDRLGDLVTGRRVAVTEQQVTAVVRRCLDAGLLRADGSGVDFAVPWWRTVVRGWLRPSDLGGWHAVLAEESGLGPAERERHRMAARVWTAVEAPAHPEPASGVTLGSRRPVAAFGLVPAAEWLLSRSWDWSSVSLLATHL